ncbi:unnamed protein product [Rhodiola kirilowii]
MATSSMFTPKLKYNVKVTQNQVEIDRMFEVANERSSSRAHKGLIRYPLKTIYISSES